MSKEWKEIDWNDCPDCGASAEVLTETLNPPNTCNDSDHAKCSECGLIGSVSVDDDDGSAWIQWEEHNSNTAAQNDEFALDDYIRGV